MSMVKICIVVGTRPNFIKITQFRNQIAAYPRLSLEIVHTGQHFDENMADVFLRQFDLMPDHILETGPGNPAVQIGKMIVQLAELFEKQAYNLVICVGDVNSTLAAAIAANKLGLPLAHLESGLRSGDLSMPEEHNRMIADQFSQFYFVTEPSGLENLQALGKEEEVFFVGNTMIDTLVHFEPQIQASDILSKLNVRENEYLLTTIHRPATVDNREGLQKLIALFRSLLKNWKIVFPIHPRTVKKLKAFGMYESLVELPGMTLVDPLGYFDFQKLIASSAWVLTDSGGIQEETTYRLKPCLTLRPNTERPVTITKGTNTLVDFDIATIENFAAQIESGNYKSGSVPELWDGKATGRILEIINRILQ